MELRVISTMLRTNSDGTLQKTTRWYPAIATTTSKFPLFIQKFRTALLTSNCFHRISDFKTGEYLGLPPDVIAYNVSESSLVLSKQKPASYFTMLGSSDSNFKL